MGSIPAGGATSTARLMPCCVCYVCFAGIEPLSLKANIIDAAGGAAKRAPIPTGDAMKTHLLLQVRFLMKFV